MPSSARGRTGYGYAITLLSLRDIFPDREIFVRPYACIKSKKNADSRKGCPYDM